MSADLVSMNYGCVELVDPYRTASYVTNYKNNPTPFNVSPPATIRWQSLDVECSCNVLKYADIGYGVSPVLLPAYTNPEADVAPWFSPVHSESKGFFGFVVDDVEDLSRVPGQRQVTPRATMSGGSTLGAHRKIGRCFKVVLYAFAVNEQSMRYGMRWLSDKLTFSCGDDCTLCDLEIRTSCPKWMSTHPTYTEFDRDRWTLPEVGLVEGPYFIDNPIKDIECNVRRIEFTLCSQSPWMYKCPKPIVSPQAICNTAEMRARVEVSSTVGEDGIIIEIDAPTANVTNFTLTIQEDTWGYVSNPSSAPVGWVDPTPCGYISVPIIPAGTKLIYDTAAERIQVQLAGGEIKEGSSLVAVTPGTPPTFPTLRCGSFALKMNYDNVACSATAASIGVWTIHRELIG